MDSSPIICVEPYPRIHCGCYYFDRCCYCHKENPKVNETDLDASEGLYNMGGLTKWGLPPNHKESTKSQSQSLIPYQAQLLAPIVGNPNQPVQLPNVSRNSSRRVSLNVEKRSDPIIGYRGWTLGKELTDLGLYPANPGYGAWIPGKQHAVCKHSHGHQAPEVTCDCGYYLCRTPVRAIAHLPTSTINVVGACIAWGHVVEHKAPDGWRAEWVKPLALIQWDNAEPEQLKRLEWIARYYGVPLVKNADALKALATEMYG